MTKEKVQLIAGALLHDIGKVIYRQGDGRKHSVSGYEFLKQEAKVTEKNILESVRYHHVAELRNASLSENSYAYITYVADNIASAADRRKREEEEEKGYIKTIPLESVFNVLNGNDGRLHYQRGFLGKNATIHYPTNEEVQYDENYYLTIKANILDNLHGIRCWDAEHINSLLEILEANISLIPSSTARDELADISLYDHVKLTAAIATCIYDFLGEKGITDYKKELFTNEKEFWNTEAFAMFSMDLSGIQDFIYTIHSEGALRNLRARSFYLEIMMEHIIDTLLDRLELSRANLVYAGGGHCYILAANTTNTRGIISDFKKELNQWMTEKYDVSLYVASGYASCCANNLKNIPDGSYSDIFKRVSNDISGNKANRYTAEQIVLLNRRSAEDYTRECKVCKKLSHLTKDGMCENCASILRSSGDILYKDFFSIISEPEASALSLRFGY
ncbi:MAG: type III-A CRISPR-associated protein Cas10/Csm1, partial [Lachnospiraceae bacterium]|nr:type III-A CRISPR-associated protein Cas10/Csm1 [Lachnospiraceae bacterium]